MQISLPSSMTAVFTSSPFLSGWTGSRGTVKRPVFISNPQHLYFSCSTFLLPRKESPKLPAFALISTPLPPQPFFLSKQALIFSNSAFCYASPEKLCFPSFLQVYPSLMPSLQFFHSASTTSIFRTVLNLNPSLLTILARYHFSMPSLQLQFFNFQSLLRRDRFISSKVLLIQFLREVERPLILGSYMMFCFRFLRMTLNSSISYLLRRLDSCRKWYSSSFWFFIQFYFSRIIFSLRNNWYLEQIMVPASAAIDVTDAHITLRYLENSWLYFY